MFINYNKFYKNLYNELILEQYINESILHFLMDFRKILESINHPIAKDLIRMQGKESGKDMTFIDVGADKNKVMFNKMSNIEKNVPDYYHSVLKDELMSSSIVRWDELYPNFYRDVTKNSSEIKIGRFVKKIFGDKYNEKQIEDFVNLYKSRIKEEQETFEIVDGDDIAYWYNYSNYSDTTGNLGNSCMRNVNSDVFNIYTENPDVVKMLILKKGGFIKGRALVWKIENKDVGFEYLMDRVYINYDSDYHKFIEYAKDKDWAYKTFNTYNSPESITYKEERQMNGDIEIKVRKLNYSEYPYMDTFKIFVKDVYRLFNKNADNVDETLTSDFEDVYLLEGGDGGYTELNKVMDYYTGAIISTDDAYYSWCVDSYVEIESAVTPIFGFDISYSKITPIEKENCFYHMSDWELITWDDSYWAVVLGCEYGYGFKDDFELNHDAEYIPIKFSIYAVKIKDGLFLTKHHIKLLDDYSDYIDDNVEVIDKFEYYKMLKDNNILNEIYREMTKFINTKQLSFDDRLSDRKEMEKIYKRYIDEIDSGKYEKSNYY